MDLRLFPRKSNSRIYNDNNFFSQQSFNLNYQNISDLNLPNSGSFIKQQKENIEQDQIQNNPNNNENIKKSNSLNNSSTKIGFKKNIKKRKSKNEIAGRNFECQDCHKSYLSYPALYTHRKIKHKTNISLGKRGRPKKDQGENKLEKKKYDPTNLTFFSKEERTGKTEPIEINKCIDKAFSEIYKKGNELTIKNYVTVDEHPFLNKFKKDNHDIYKYIIDGHQIIDTVLIDYLNKMSMFCNNQYYTKLIIFITLFREYVNAFSGNKIDKKKNKREYCEIYDAENFPDYSNNFIIEFLHPESKENNFGFTKDESIDLTQNLCYWLFDNNHTSSKLSLYENEK